MGLNYKAIAKICGIAITAIGALMILPAVVSFYYQETHSASIFIITAVCLCIIGSLLFFLVKAHDKKIKSRDGLISVTFVWFLAILLGAIPTFMICDISFINALFESTSGFTTTGATIFGDVESLPKGILFWRGLNHWLGGLGIITLVISILPLLGTSGRLFARAEATQTMVSPVSVKFSDTAKRIALFYCSMTVLCAVFLSFGKLTIFESIVHTMGIVSTGGFSTFNKSLMLLNDPYSLWIIILFMALGSINFMLYYYLFSSHWKEVFPDTELRFYVTVLFVGSIAISLDILFAGDIKNFGEALTHGTFNFVSIVSTTGLNSYNYDIWPTFSKMILLLAMIMGGSSASTAGGLKAYRIVVAFKLIKRNLSRRLHPAAVVSIKNDEGPMRADFVSAVAAYIFLYTLVIFVTAIILSVENFDFMTTISAAIACLGSIGPGFEEVGPLGNYEMFSVWGKVLLCFNMLGGRLELFGVILLFTRGFWDPDRFKV